MSLGIKTAIKKTVLNRKWRKLNKHNSTYISTPCDISLISVGKGTYGPIRAIHTGVDGKLSIGNYCSIAPDVAFVFNNEHATGSFSSFPFKVKLLKKQAIEAISKGGIVVEDDVWLGCRAMVLDGVTIGQGAVVAAGALVTKDVPSYAIVGGVPAKVIRYRFSKETIGEMVQIDFENIDSSFVSEHLTEFYDPLNVNIAQSIKEALNK